MKVPDCEHFHLEIGYIPLPVITVAVKPPNEDWQGYMVQSLPLHCCPDCGKAFKEVDDTAMLIGESRRKD